MTHRIKLKVGDRAESKITSRPGASDGTRFRGEFEIIHRDCDGNIKGIDKCHNVVTDEGLDALLDIMLHGTSQITTWYVIIFESDTTPDGSETYAVPVYTESTAYDEATRPEYVEAASSGQSITNSANKAVFTMNASKTIYGAGLVGIAGEDSSGSNASTPGDTGGGGTLLCCAKFTASRAVVDNDTLEVTYTLSAADDGA